VHVATSPPSRTPPGRSPCQSDARHVAHVAHPTRMLATSRRQPTPTSLSRWEWPRPLRGRLPRLQPSRGGLYKIRKSSGSAEGPVEISRVFPRAISCRNIFPPSGSSRRRPFSGRKQPTSTRMHPTSCRKYLTTCRRHLTTRRRTSTTGRAIAKSVRLTEKWPNSRGEICLLTRRRMPTY
jgi:hypothetical protein